MRFRLRPAAAGLCVLLIATTGLVAVGSNALAATPPYEPDPTSTGFITFYDAAGNVVTSGSTTARPFVNYAKSSVAGRPGDTKATLYAYTPKIATATGAFPGEALSAATVYPNAAAPAPINGFTLPVATSAATDFSLVDYFGDFPNTATDAYQGLYQLRIKTSAIGVGTNTAYSSTSILVTGTTWTQVYPVPVTPTATTTTFAVTPASPVTAGTSVSLKATINPSAAGSVQFLDGVTNLGSPVAVTAGTATLVTTSLTAATHSLTAKFTATDSTSFGNSTSAAVSYVVGSAAVTTTTALAVTPASPVVLGTSSTFTATVTPNTAVGTVQFVDGAVNVGAPVAVSGGTATFSTSALTVATHSLTAKFTPTNAANFSGSTSAAVAYTVTSVPATVTTTTLAVTPVTTAVFGATVTMSASVTPTNAVGTVQFFDGATAIGGPVAVAVGSAVKTSTTLTVGAHSLKATFTPTVPANFTPSTSAAVAYTITAAPPTTTTTALAVTPASPVAAGTSVALKATITPSTAVGSVQFFDGATALGAPVPVAAGSATLNTAALTVATHSLTAKFAPTVPANFATSTSAAVSLVVNPAPPGSTTTALTLTPAGPVVLSASVSLKATITPTAATGTVQFFDGATAIGSPVTVSAGSATLATSALAVGSHALSAAFTPATATFLGSASAAKTLVVNPPPTATTTTLAATPVGPVLAGTSVLLTATVAPSAAVGSVQFLDGTTLLGTTALASGTATLSTTALSAATHSLTAKFVPTVPANFGTSTSAAVSLVVTPKPAVSTTTTLAVSPVGPVGAGIAITLKATVSPTTAVGSVSFFDGTKLLGSVKVVAGKATLVTKTLAVGTHSLTAKFAPTSAAAFVTSTSAAVSLVVKKAATVQARNTGGQLLTSGASLSRGTRILLTGTGFEAGELVTVTVQSVTITLGTVTTADDGTVTTNVTVPASLADGAHTFSLAGTTNAVSYAFTIAAVGTGTGTGSGSGSAGSGSGSSGSGSGLPHTGGESAPLALVAFGFLVLGGALILIARRRSAFVHP